jgi:hypothetical protein
MPGFQCHKCELLFATQNELNWHLREDHHVRTEPAVAPSALEPSSRAGDRAPAVAAGADGDGEHPNAARRPRWWPPWRR